ncbi:glutathione-regulated potassium-efflux system protein KefC [Acidovorax lacteus]|uniref:Glutathione-regulated potassium-efflux system protein KefC n=1 Tax=Acidovorax lacteus TaxID=1924988 RepID=A0ABP8L7V4_9BURK
MEHAPTWLLNACLFLGAAVVAVPLARALGLGAIIGYLGAGIAIGPWGLGFVSHPQDILHFAEFGVVLMLFLVGLELQPARLWSLRRPIFGWGGLQVLGCAAALWALALAAGLDWRTGLIGALGLALSSTAIALQVLQERNLMRTTGGQTAFSILLFQDIAAIPMLALLPLLAVAPAAAPGADTPLWLEIARTVGLVAALVLGGRLLLRPLLRWIAKSRTPEVFTAAALLLVVGMALVMVAAGLSMALGAFLAGVLLADSEYRRELETDIEPFKGLLLGLFFIAVGMSIDFGVLLQYPGRMALLLLVLLVAKGLVIALLARAARLPGPERPAFTLLLAQGGEFAFVVFQAAVGAQVLAADTASLLNGAVALSMLLGPLLLTLADRWQRRRGGRLDATAAPPPGVETLHTPQEAPVVICGFGRYGQIVARMLHAQGVATTVLDHSVEILEVARIFGFRVFYGDATRLDLLRTAGVEQARALVIAVDDPEQSLRIAALARKHFAQVPVVARARDISHWNALRDLGVTLVQRELFESSLVSARSVLEQLGMPPEQAVQLADRFRAHNLELADRLYPHHKDRARFIAVAREGRQQLEEQMARERQAVPPEGAPPAAASATDVPRP